MGVFDGSMTEVVAECLKILGVRRAFVVHGGDGLDEISVCAPTKVSHLSGGRVKTYEFNPLKYLPSFAPFSDLKGGSPEENARMTLGILEGKIRGGARSVSLLNAAAGIVVGGLADDFEDALALAEKSIDSGAALSKLETLVEFSRQ